MTTIAESLEGESFVTDFLQHYGVKGMRWGVTKNSSSGSGSGKNTEDHVRVDTDSQRITGVGPKHRETPSSDAVKAALYRGVASRQSTDALSNQELQHLVNRMNLEQNYSRLTQSPSNLDKIKRGQSKVNAVLSVGKTINEVNNFMNSPLGKQLKSALK